MKGLTKEQWHKLPRYVTLGSTALRLINKSKYHQWAWEPDDFIYYRENGCWECDFKIDSDGKLKSVMPDHPELNDRILKPVNKTKYIRDNGTTSMKSLRECL